MTRNPNHALAATDAMALLRLGEQVGYALTSSGRIESANDPDSSPGPFLSLSGCVEGNLVRVRHDVSNSLANDLIEIAGQEPPWCDADREPRCLKHLVARLSREMPVTKVELEVDYRIPVNLSYECAVEIVRSDSAEGKSLVARFAKDGMPLNLSDAGFKHVDDLWEPWCVAREGESVASIAFTARLATKGAAIGVYTFPGFRTRGLAAAVTSAWSQHPSLARRVLFYSARRDNRSSRRVIERLQLPRLGASLRIE